MAFDINTAKPVQSSSSGGFDLSTAKPSQEEAEQSLWNKTKAAFKGNAEHKDAGNVHDWLNTLPQLKSFGFGMKTAAADMFGNEEDVVNRIKEFDPSIQFSADANGNTMFTARDGKQYYINNPGLDVSDALNFGGEAGAYAAGGLATAPIRNLGTRVVATAATEGGINAAAQKVAGRDEINKGEMLTAAALGGAFEALTPAVSSVWRKFKNMKTSDFNAGKEVAKELGADGLNAEQTKKLGNMVRNLDPEQVTPETILQHVELNQTPTLGTLTKNQDILDTEHALKNTGRESTRSQMRMVDDANAQGLQKAVTGFQDNVAGGQARTSDYLDAAGQIGQAVKSKAQAEKSRINSAYDNVQGAYLGVEPFKEAPQRIKKALSGGNVILDPSVTPRANAAISDLQKSIAKMGDAKAVSWQAVDAQRKRLNSLFKGADSADKRALQIAKQEYDAIVDDAFEGALFSGSDEAINSLKSARGMAADYFSKYQKQGSGDRAGKAIEDWVQNDVAPEHIANAIFNVSGTLKQNAPDMAKRYLEIVGKNTPEHQLIKEMTVQRLASGRDKASLRNSLKKSLTNQKTFMNEVFTPKELGFLSRTVSFIDQTTRKGDLGKSSGSAERFFRWANKAAGSDTSLSGILNAGKKALSMMTGSESRVLKLPMQQIGVNPLVPLGASQAGTIQTNGQ